MTRPYAIYTDATADIPKELPLDQDIMLLPMSYMLNDQPLSFDNSWNLQQYQDFYAQLRKKKPFKTSQINFMNFVDAFIPVLEKGMDILYICFSSGMSNSYSSALLASKELEKRYPAAKILCVDSLSATAGEGLLTLHAALLRNENASIEDTYRWIQTNRLHVHHWFTVDDLFHLSRGGRFPASKALAGSILNVKPIMHVTRDGHLSVYEKTRGRKAALRILAALAAETMQISSMNAIMITHGDAYDDAIYVADQIRAHSNSNDIYISYLNPIVGGHIGPGSVVVCHTGVCRDV